MAKTFYTEHDIEDMFHGGKTSLAVNDDVVLTDLAYEKARSLGVTLVREQDEVPCAPVRPYIAMTPKITASYPAKEAMTEKSIGLPSHPTGRTELHDRIRNAVFSQIGNVDAELLDRIIIRVLNNLGLR